jgi:hypothetical protein
VKIKVYVIDLEIPPRVKRWALRIGIPAAVLLGGGAIAYATGLPVTWSSGQTLYAADLNNNFAYLQNEITGDAGLEGQNAALQSEITASQNSISDLQGQLTALQNSVTALQAWQAQATTDGEYSLGATYCGDTAATLGSFSGPGTLTGYASARGQCQQVSGCSTTSVHMCTADEIARTRQLNISIPTGWYTTGIAAEAPPGEATECNGWTINTGGVGSIWQSNGQPAQTTCYTTAYPILCCN